MGSSCCKRVPEEHVHTATMHRPGRVTRSDSVSSTSSSGSSTSSEPPRIRLPAHLTPEFVDDLVVEMLRLIGSFIENETQTPVSLAKLHMIAEREEGWIQVMTSMVNMIPLNSQFGPSAITILFDDCPLPSKAAVLKFQTTQLTELAARSTENTGETEIWKDRNFCIVLGCIAEKLAGPYSVAVLNAEILDYLIDLMVKRREPSVVMFAIIALEKFGHTTENKVIIKARLERESLNPLLELEKLVNSEDCVWRQVGFCAQWSLDNLFLVEGRKLSYETVDMSAINVILNSRDVSEYLKISCNGLEARSDAYSFESVRCTGQMVDEGCWYYECTVITDGVMQIGLATQNSLYLKNDGCGIGDDLFSLSLDGCRRLVWYKALPTSVMAPRPWAPGDVIGCLIDIPAREVIFSLNGVELVSCSEIFNVVRKGFYVAASFMAFQQCRFNFGHEPFKFPPQRPHSSWNVNCHLTPEEKKVVPKRIAMEELMAAGVCEDSCTLCFDRTACCTLEPCNHTGFCMVCAEKLKECPMCRAPIMDVRCEGEEEEDDDE